MPIDSLLTPPLHLARRWQKGLWLFWASLILVLAVQQLFIAGSLFRLIVSLAPLLMFSHAIVRGKRRPLLWLCFVLLLYILKGIEGVVLAPHHWLNWGLAICSSGTFVCAMLFAHSLLKAQVNQLPRPAHPGQTTVQPQPETPL
jgi:uncharacterized membrane protein